MLNDYYDAHGNLESNGPVLANSAPLFEHDGDNHFAKNELVLTIVQAEYPQSVASVTEGHFALNGSAHRGEYAACYTPRKYHNEDKLPLHDLLKALLKALPFQLLQAA